MSAVPNSARGIAQAVREGSISAVEVTKHFLGQISERDGDLHAFNLVDQKGALDSAAALDAARESGSADLGPLAGVPVALKDNICTRGLETTCSSRILAGFRPPYDATVVTRLRSAGAVIVGKTNLDEFAMGSSTENSCFGPSRHPLDTTLVPGGSSGGSAVAVAAGLAPLALGSDTGGSIRQPAALTGVVGAKPTYGRVSRYGLIAYASSLDQIGPFATSVADAATLMEVLVGHDPADSTSLDAPMPNLDEVLDRGVKGLRIGLVEEMRGEFGAGLAPDVAAQLERAVDALRGAGAEIVSVSIPSVSYALAAYYLVATAEASSNLARFDGVRYGLRVDGADVNEMYVRTRSAGFGNEVKRRIMLGTYALSAGYYDAFYGRSQQVRTLLIRDFRAAYEKADVLLTPTSPSVAWPIGAKVDDPLQMYLSDVFTVPSNMAGDPAISVPFGTGDRDLPVGVQVLAPALGEAVMFQVAAELERAGGAA